MIDDLAILHGNAKMGVYSAYTHNTHWQIGHVRRPQNAPLTDVSSVGNSQASRGGVYIFILAGN